MRGVCLQMLAGTAVWEWEMQPTVLRPTHQARRLHDHPLSTNKPGWSTQPARQKHWSLKLQTYHLGLTLTSDWGLHKYKLPCTKHASSLRESSLHVTNELGPCNPWSLPAKCMRLLKQFCTQPQAVKMYEPTKHGAVEKLMLHSRKAGAPCLHPCKYNLRINIKIWQIAFASI